MSDTDSPICQTGDPVLRKQAEIIPQEDIGSAKLAALIARMKEALSKEKNGVAIAAPQVGESLRLFVVAGRMFVPEKKEGEEEDTKETLPPPPDRAFINPEIIRRSKTKSDMHEGCLSVRGSYGWVERNDKATVRAQDEHGKTFTMNGSGLLAQIFQHECDHLDGTLFTDKVSRLDDEKKEEHIEETA